MKNGQLSMVNILFFGILVFIMAIFTPVLNTFLSQMIVEGNITGLSATIMNLIVPFMWFGLVITLFIYVAPIRQQ